MRLISLLGGRMRVRLRQTFYCRSRDSQISDALLEPEQGESTGFGEDLFVPPAQFSGLLDGQKMGKLHG